jgi:hypothetical protein
MNVKGFFLSPLIEIGKGLHGRGNISYTLAMTQFVCVNCSNLKFIDTL